MSDDILNLAPKQLDAIQSYYEKPLQDEITRLRASLRHIASGKCVHPENEARQALQETGDD